MQHRKFGRYELLHKMAAGGMAEIFLARQWGQSGFFKDVVIKRLFPYFAENPHVLRLFQDEARLLSELSHPNIPQVYDLGQTDGFWYIAMEHVGGFSLVDVCRAAAKQSKLLPLGVSVGVISQVCAALHHAHEHCDREGRSLRIVHCDVTPHNVMITLDGMVKVFDFGVAQTAVRDDVDVGVVRGTYSYMAPEQVRGKALDKRADVFAVGVILYELTTGTRLFTGNDVQIMTAVVEKDAPPPSSVVENYPRELEEIVMAALHRDRGARTPSAAHLMLGLERFCINSALVASPLVVSRYVRSLFPYERAREAGLGMVPAGAEDRAELASQTQPDRPVEEYAETEGLSLEQMEEKLLIEELRRLSISSPSGDEVYAESPPAPLNLPAGGPADDVLELDSSEMFLPDAGRPAGEADQGDEVKKSKDLERIGLGLEEFGDEDIKPVVLLSPKPKAPEQSKSSGEFMSDLERRLEEEEIENKFEALDDDQYKDNESLKDRT